MLFIKAKSFIPDVPAGSFGIPKYSSYQKKYENRYKKVKVRVHHATGKVISPIEENDLIEKEISKNQNEEDFDCNLDDEGGENSNIVL